MMVAAVVASKVRNRNEAQLLVQVSCAGRKMDQLVQLFITELQHGDVRRPLDHCRLSGSTWQRNRW
jgi:hypothetical protein